MSDKTVCRSISFLTSSDTDVEIISGRLKEMGSKASLSEVVRYALRQTARNLTSTPAR